MVKIPEPLRVVFDTFPLKTYPSIPDDKNPIGTRHFRSKNNAAQTDESFNLAVYNLQHITFKKNGISLYIPTDPVSLATALILCDKHNLRMPDGSENESNHGMVPMCNTASSDNELPMLIEEKKEVLTCIVQSSQLRDSISSKTFSESSSGYLFNELLDSFQDLWIFILLSEFPQSNYKAMTKLFYSDPQIENSETCEYLTLVRYMMAIPNWNNFRVRYPHLFNESFATRWSPSRYNRETLLELLTVGERKSLEAVYLAKLSEFGRAVPLFMKHFESAEDSYAKRTMMYKFASFFVCVDQFVPESTHVSRLVRGKLEDALLFSEELISKS